MSPTTRPAYQIQTGQWIVNAEKRTDRQGRIRVYLLPAADGGGTYEIAGINDRFDLRMAEHLRNLIELKQYTQAELDAAQYILGNTDIVQAWTTHPALEVYLRDTCFNRGPTGAAKVLQLALGHAHTGIEIDGHIGPITLGYAHAMTDPQEFLGFLRSAREIYERRIAPPIGKRAAFWPGLVNRWNNALTFAKTFL